MIAQLSRLWMCEEQGMVSEGGGESGLGCCSAVIDERALQACATIY